MSRLKSLVLSIWTWMWADVVEYWACLHGGMADQAATGDCKWHQSEKSFGGSCPYVRSIQADLGHHPAACCRVRTLHQTPTSQYVQNLWVLIVLHTIQVPKSGMKSQGIKFWCSFWYKTYHHWIECYGLIIQVVRPSEGFFRLKGHAEWQLCICAYIAKLNYSCQEVGRTEIWRWLCLTDGVHHLGNTVWSVSHPHVQWWLSTTAKSYSTEKARRLAHLVRACLFPANEIEALFSKE